MFDQRKPRTVICKLHSQSAESEFNIQCSDISDVMLSIITPIPVTPERQWYLYENIRPLVPYHAQDILCPKPSCPRITFSQVRAVKEGGNLVRTLEGSKTENTAVRRSQKSSKLSLTHIRKLKPRTKDFYLQRGERRHVHTVMKQDTLIK